MTDVPELRYLVPAADLDELFAAAGPAPDPDLWAADIASADQLGDDTASDPWDRA